MQPKREGFVSFKGYRVFYQIYGKPNKQKRPLLILHGGPGSAHNYLLGLAELQKDREVVFYDQLGCGESDRPNDASLWNLDTFVDEIAAVRKALSIEELHLFGHSWGGMLAIEYLLRQPQGIRSAILASSMVSIPLYNTEVDRLKQALPGRAHAVMLEHEAAGTTDSIEYQHAYLLYKKRHLFRGDTFPSRFSIPQEKVGTVPYNLLWGPSEACANGALRSWDRINDLRRIGQPVLITSGQYDELTPWQAGITRDQLQNANLRIFTNGSHMTHIEQPDTYLETVGTFLRQYD